MSQGIQQSPAFAQADIYLLGSGMTGFVDITLRTQAALKQCRQVFYLHDMPSLDDYLEEVAPGAVNLMPVYYLDGRRRMDIYRDVAGHVVDAAAGEKPVGLLVHGHPMFFSLITRLILEQADGNGLHTEVLPAVSSLDSLFVDLRLDAGEHGLQIHEVSSAIMQALPLNPRVATLLLQVGGILNFKATRQSSVSQDVAPLQDYLLRFYPPSHQVTIAECRIELGYDKRLTTVRIDALQDAAPAMNYNATLYVPALAD